MQQHYRYLGLIRKLQALSKDEKDMVWASFSQTLKINW